MSSFISALASKQVVASVGLTCKLFLHSGLCSLQLNGLDNLVRALEGAERDPKQGIITVCNHISTLDDPVIWGVLPTRFYLDSRKTRWALGASEIMFTNPVFSKFFSLGQTLETFRGQGIYQDAVNTAIEKVDQGHWVHLYGEGKVNQPKTYPRDTNGRASLPRFKWGVGRIVMEAKVTPKVIPMWISGFDQLMPEGRPFPSKYFPKAGAQLSITFGEPIPQSRILEALDRSKIVSSSHYPSAHHDIPSLGSDTNQDNSNSDLTTNALVRAKITLVLHDHVEALGYQISGKLLGGLPTP